MYSEKKSLELSAVRVLRSILRLDFERFALPAVVGILAIALAGFDAGPKDQGIGGTGTIFNNGDTGISGTGYFGTITDFGSVIINGQEVEIADNTVVRMNGKRAALSDLKIGQVIAMRAQQSASGQWARDIEIVHSVVGQIDEFDTATGRGEILGQPVDFNSRIDSQPLEIGAWIAVSGLRSINGVIVASLVEPAEPNRFSVVGSSEQIRAAVKFLNLKSVSVPAHESLMLTGRVVGQQAQASSIKPYSLMALLRETRSVSIESYVSRGDAKSDTAQIMLLGQKVRSEVRNLAVRSQQVDRAILLGEKNGSRIRVINSSRAIFSDRSSKASVSSETKVTKNGSLMFSNDGSDDGPGSSSDDSSDDRSGGSSDDGSERNSGGSSDDGSDNNSGGGSDDGSDRNSDGGSDDSSSHDSDSGSRDGAGDGSRDSKSGSERSKGGD